MYLLASQSDGMATITAAVVVRATERRPNWHAMGRTETRVSQARALFARLNPATVTTHTYVRKLPVLNASAL